MIAGGLLLYGWENCLDDDTGQPPAKLWDLLLAYEYPVFICGTTEWEPRNTLRNRRLLRLVFKIPEYDERQQLWQHYTGSKANGTAELASKFRFTPGQIARAVNTAADLAHSRGEDITLG